MIVAVMVDEPSDGMYFGGDVAAPVFSQVVQQTLRTAWACSPTWTSSRRSSAASARAQEELLMPLTHCKRPTPPRAGCASG
jgi:cell division protein FtsI (penicillin-binding protein 3)